MKNAWKKAEVEFLDDDTLMIEMYPKTQRNDKGDVLVEGYEAKKRFSASTLDDAAKKIKACLAEDPKSKKKGTKDRNDMTKAVMSDY